MKIPSPRSQKKARIEVIPLIDIVFFLLATFVMVSMSMVKNEGVTVNVPIASTSAPQDRQEYTAITVTASGDYFFNKEAATLEAIVEKLKVLKETEKEPRVFINGDEKAEFGKAIAVLDETRKLGISKVAIETRKK